MLSTGQAARQLNVSSERVRQLADSGELPVNMQTPLGRLFDEAAVQAPAEDRKRRHVLQFAGREQPDDAA